MKKILSVAAAMLALIAALNRRDIERKTLVKTTHTKAKKTQQE
jgi:hypothetical protein